MTTALVTLTKQLAATLNMGGGEDLLDTLKATAFKGPVTDAQMTALLIVATQYKLNPWTKEIYAFPDRNNGIVPVVGVDGWSRIINSHPQLDGIEFEQDDERCTCLIYRKDRSRPTRVTEYMAECRRAGVGPWTSHPRRMLRHKALIQCSRLAFGFSGLFDQDEAERIVEGATRDMGPAQVVTEAPSAALLQAAEEAARHGVDAYRQFWGKTTPADRKTLAAEHNRLKAAASDADKARTVESPAKVASKDAPSKTFEEVLQMVCDAKNRDQLMVAGSWIEIFSSDEQDMLNAKFNERMDAMVD